MAADIFGRPTRQPAFEPFDIIKTENRRFYYGCA